MSTIGLLNEKPLHAALKRWYAETGDRFEVPVDGFVVDIVRGELLVEIQTGGLSSVRAKLAALAESHEVRLVYPIAVARWIVRAPAVGAANRGRRKSPKRGRLEDLFDELVAFAPLIRCQNFTVEVLLIHEEKVRRLVGSGRWRRKGWGTEERRLLEVVDRRIFRTPADWRATLPDKLRSFTARDLAEALGIALDLARKMVYLLSRTGVLELRGRRGRAHLYALSGA